MFALIALPFLLMAAVGLLVVLIWTVRRAQHRGRAHLWVTIGVWAGAGLLVTVALVAANTTFGRSQVSASAEQLSGRWVSESSHGTATIDLQSDGSVFVEGVPSTAAGAENAGLPPVLSGGGTWEAGSSPSVALTCASGRTITLRSMAMESPAGSMYLQFLVGDPDAPTYFEEFSRADSDGGRDTQTGSRANC